jgi:glycosyltransferase involved in cell wall biosynthesis
MSERPLVSIVVPSFNQGRYIRETIDSILSQDYRPIEVLVMDGGSTDETVDVLKSYRDPELLWISERDRGVVDAVNKGLARAKGGIIGIQSSDDVYLPGAIARAVAAFDADPSLGLVYGDVEFIDAESRSTGRSMLPPFDFLEHVAKASFIPQPSAFFTAAAMRGAGLWRQEVSYAADADFFLRIAERFRVQKIDALLARYRYHETQRDKESERVQRDWLETASRWLSSPDKRIRTAAQVGVFSLQLRYLPPERWLQRTSIAYRLVATRPALLLHRDFRRSNPDLVPGRYPVMRMLSRLKRRLMKITRAGE